MINLNNLRERIIKYLRHIFFIQLKHNFAKLKIIYIIKFQKFEVIDIERLLLATGNKSELYNSVIREL